VRILQRIVYPDGTYEIFLPLYWEWKVEDYDNVKEIISGIDASSKPDEQNFINLISVQKIKDLTGRKDTESEYLAILEMQKQNSNRRIIESGKTNLLENNTYYVHSKSDNAKYGPIEMITLITESKNDDAFYYLTASASGTKELKMNMSIMVQCLKTFKELKK
jgi:hypothetical protein